MNKIGLAGMETMTFPCVKSDPVAVIKAGFPGENGCDLLLSFETNSQSPPWNWRYSFSCG